GHHRAALSLAGAQSAGRARPARRADPPRRHPAAAASPDRAHGSVARAPAGAEGTARPAQAAAERRLRALSSRSASQLTVEFLGEGGRLGRVGELDADDNRAIDMVMANY